MKKPAAVAIVRSGLNASCLRAVSSGHLEQELFVVAVDADRSEEKSLERDDTSSRELSLMAGH